MLKLNQGIGCLWLGKIPIFASGRVALLRGSLMWTKRPLGRLDPKRFLDACTLYPNNVCFLLAHLRSNEVTYVDAK